jgi:hypothetical protein
MIKVQQSSTNPCFLEEAGDYLVANGYSRKDGQHLNGCIYFFNGDKAIMVYNDNVDFMVYDDGEEGQRRAGYYRYKAHTGIADLDLFKWMLLFHIADIVPMQQFIQAARKEVPEKVAALNDVFVQIFDHFRITENHNAVPLGY